MQMETYMLNLQNGGMIFHGIKTQAAPNREQPELFDTGL